MELQDEQAARLDGFATSLRKIRGEATAQLMEEGLRHAEFPGIEFRDSMAGREAYVVGTRLAVWEVLLIAEEPRDDAGKAARRTAAWSLGRTDRFPVCLINNRAAAMCAEGRLAVAVIRDRHV